MDIVFDNPKHKKMANDYNLLCKKYNNIKGIDSAEAIILTLNVLQAADTLDDIAYSYRPHPLKGNYKGYFAVDVDKKHRIIFRPNHDEDKEFRIDNFKTIKRIIIIELFKDYH